MKKFEISTSPDVTQEMMNEACKDYDVKLKTTSEKETLWEVIINNYEDHCNCFWWRKFVNFTKDLNQYFN